MMGFVEAWLAPARTSEWVNLFFFSFFIILAWLRPLAWRKRLEVTALGAAGIGLILAALGAGDALPVIARDLLPAPLMLFVYWQSGRFFVAPNERIQTLLERFDQKVLGRLLRREERSADRSWVAGFLELAYLLCYPLVPLGVILLYAVGLQGAVDEYWVIVLLSTYLCYVLLPFVQMLPPRLLAAEKEPGARPGLIRLLNLGILRHASIQVNTFPSAHVASTIAASLVLLRFLPLAGAAFMVLAIGIAAGAVIGRYHYVADALIGIALAGVVFLQI
jgi:PAP2 superfamily